MTTGILCCQCRQEMKRAQDADFKLPKTGLLVEKYICSNCGNVEEIANFVVEARTLNDVISGLEIAMESIKEKGKVTFEQLEAEETSEGIAWRVSPSKVLTK